jgi:hypothetical protein
VRFNLPRTIFAVALLLLAAPLDCLAKATSSPFMVFPPADCSATEPRVITWQDGATTTRCATAQEILRLALPGCRAGQHVLFDGSSFVCEGTPVPKAKGTK